MARQGLDTYRRRRDFAATPEPGAAEAPTADARAGDAAGPRFVIQEHSATRLHWDLRLEHDGALASWAIPNGLPWAPKENRKAVHTEDHPLEYLDFHGEIPKGQYGAGTMTIWDRGTYELLKWEERKVEVDLHGERVRGRYALFATGAGGAESKDWMIHRMDPPQEGGWVLGQEPMPERLVPMLAKGGPLPADDARWAYEVKWDGVRAICFSEPGRMRLVTRNGNDVTPRYPELNRLNRALSMHRAILDGEVVAFEMGSHPPRPSFAALQGRMHLTREAQVRRLAREAPVSYLVFDLLWLDGQSLMHLPYEQRRARLRELGLDGERWQTPDHVVGGGADLLAATRQQGLEGIVAKRLDSPYEPGRRSGCWVKVKNTNRQELVIGGWLPGEGRRRERIGALLVGVHDDGGAPRDGRGDDAGDAAGAGGAGPLRFAGRVGTGFTEAELDRLARLLQPLERDDSPFDAVPATLKLPRNAVFVEPELVCEVEFVEWTRDGVLRAPSYKGLRDDKAAAAVVAEPAAAGGAPAPAPGPAPPPAPAEIVIREELPKNVVRAEVSGPPTRELRLSNLDKQLWPSGHTKRDLVEYLLAVAPVLLPHLEHRPLTLKRYPNGTEGQHFYEKQAPSHRPAWVPTAPVRSESKVIKYVLAQEPATLAWLGNLADLELHTPMHRASETGELSPPTMIAFDLDPGPPAGLLECCRVAVVLHGMFEHLGLRSLPKTSGSKGLQVYVPLNVPDVDYRRTKGFAKAVAELLEAEASDLVVSRQAKALRPGKVLVDWSQNDVNKTTVCVYSPRARDRPTVSAPATWDEVHDALAAGDADRLVHDLDGVRARIEQHGDLFADALGVVQELPA